MGASFVAELMKLVRRPALWVLVGLWLLLTVLFGYVIPYLVYRDPPPRMSPFERLALLATMLPSGWLGNAVGGFPLFGGAFLLITGALVAGSEYGWGTMATILIQHPGRLKVFTGQVLALGVVVVVFELVVLGPDALASYLVARHLDAAMNWPPLSQIGRAALAGLLILGFWAVAGVLLAILFRGTALAIGLGLVYLFVIATLISGFTSQLSLLETLDKYLPRANAGSLAGSFVLGGRSSPGVSHLVSTPHAVAVLFAYGIGFLLVAALVFARRDVSE